jgi:hypothetical protein
MSVCQAIDWLGILLAGDVGQVIWSGSALREPDVSSARGANFDQVRHAN